MAFAMSDQNFDRLLEEQESGITRTSLNLEQLKKFKLDYENVISKLQELQKSLTKPAYLPFARKALVYGRLVHTNEILVHLGGNNEYFAELSTYEAVQLLQRRISKLDESIGLLEQQKSLLEDRKQYTSEFSQTRRILTDSGKLDASIGEDEEVEIRENYDSDTERQWRQKHIQSRQEERRLLSQIPSESVKRKVRFRDPSSDASGSDEDSCSDETVTTIYFQHSSVLAPIARSEVADLSTLTVTEAVDMINKFGKISGNVVALERQSTQPFGGIVERDSITTDVLTSVPIQLESPRPSRFRSERLKQHIV
ncbi:unconventional prefoldin RPB5 interactor [Clonorchis sinensis]|uniref:Unconventional prefoldin RPB5 interactor n=1 Tax=Clonorchis sinensis TaxID=79923 RepID=H2KTC8_CLOSI|nr:unconventional prefoldin RPB5 interactor [Clonorchis sinensis]